jgi:PAS domain S-box-containing protein
MLGETFAVMVVASDITEQVVARKELEKIKDTLNLAIETSAIGVWTTELANNHLTLSPRARLIHGIPEGLTITWRESMKMIQDEFRSRVSAHISAAVKTGTSFTEEYWINPMNGSKPRWLRSNGKAYYNEDHKPIYVTGTILDITEQRQDEQRKNDFIGMVSHELKTPLTTLTALIQMLGQKANRANDDFSTGVLARAGKQVKTMNAMINGFLNVSRLESGKIQLVKKTFNLEELLSDVIEEFKLIAITHHIQVTSVERISVFADYDKIVSVFTNFLTNAIKYSPKGQQIDVVCKVCGNKAQVSVKDEGMGIKPEDLQRLFERYYRVESVENQHIAGFGLGLYLSAEIIKRHDGEIWAESENGAGSTFYFSLPL